MKSGAKLSSKYCFRMKTALYFPLVSVKHAEWGLFWELKPFAGASPSTSALPSLSAAVCSAQAHSAVVLEEVGGSPAEKSVLSGNQAGQKVQWSERLREEARPGGGAGQSRGSKASCLIALSDSTPALDGFFFTLPLKRTGCAFGVKPSRKC